MEKFFDRVNHDILMYKLSKDISDKRVLKLIRRYLQSGIMINGVVVSNEEGTPQGGPLSPILSNIILDELDKELENRGHKFCRYADDCNIYVKSKIAGERVIENITNFIERISKLNQINIGWINYYGIEKCKDILEQLDKWIRQRLRMCIWK